MGKATLEWKEIEIVFNIPGGLQGLRNQRQRGAGAEAETEAENPCDMCEGVSEG